MFAYLKRRERGTLRPVEFQRAESTKMAYSLGLSLDKEFAHNHRGGVTSLKLEKFEQRYLLSAGADGRCHIYDLADEKPRRQIEPVASISRADKHLFSISSVSWFPFDSGAFLTSSYDGTIRVWDTNLMQAAFVFDMEARVYCQAISPIATHTLVASAIAGPHVRLCDLKSCTNVHSLVGHKGSVLSVSWSPRDEHTLYSGGTDGTLRVWDIRRANACLASFDQHNNKDKLAEINRAHGRGINGLTPSSDGRFLISLGMDEKIRLWDTTTYTNMLVNYGTLWRNRFKAYMGATTSDNNDVWPPLLYVPSDDREVLVYDLMNGSLKRRLRGAYGRVTCVEKRTAFQELFSGSTDCEILAWAPVPSQRGPALLQEQADETFMDTWSSPESSEGEE